MWMKNPSKPTTLYVSTVYCVILPETTLLLPLNSILDICVCVRLLTLCCDISNSVGPYLSLTAGTASHHFWSSHFPCISYLHTSLGLGNWFIRTPLKCVVDLDRSFMTNASVQLWELGRMDLKKKKKQPQICHILHSLWHWRNCQGTLSLSHTHIMWKSKAAGLV